VAQRQHPFVVSTIYTLYMTLFTASLLKKIEVNQLMQTENNATEDEHPFSIL
jgi:hypothetical protein